MDFFGPPVRDCIRIQAWRRYFKHVSPSGKGVHGRIKPRSGRAASVPSRPDGDKNWKYRESGFDRAQTSAVRKEPIYLLFFSVSPWLRGAKVLSLPRA